MLYGEAEIRETVDAIADYERPAVSVSLNQLKHIELDTLQTKRRYTEIYYRYAAQNKSTAKASPHYTVRSPYDEWNVTVYQVGRTRFSPFRNIDETYRAAKLVPWMAYITTAFLQNEPGPFLEYLRLIQSARGNPWVDPVFYGENTSAKRFAWADTTLGVETFPVYNGYPAISLYPHTFTSDANLDMSITLDRFKEVVIYDALDKAFTILDIAKTTDPQFLEWAHSKVLNRSQYVKSQIGESSVVKIYKDGVYAKSVSVTLNPQLKDMFWKAVDDALVLIRQNRLKLAERTIAAQAAPVERAPEPERMSFQVEAYMQPVSVPAKTIQLSTAALQFSSLVSPQSWQDVSAEAPVPPKKNMALPIAGAAAVAALGIYAATR